MKNSHLTQVFRNFSQKEFREFKKWLLSPAHNQREDVMLLFDYLSNSRHLYNDKLLSKERIYSKFFKKAKYDDAKFRQTIFFLNKATEEYLIYNDLREDEVRSQMALASVYRKKNMPKAFLKTIKKTQSLQEKNRLRNEHYHRNEYLFEKERYSFFENQQRNIKMNLQEVSDALDITYFADKLRQSCLMLAHQKVYKTDYYPGLLSEVLQHVEQKQYFKIPAIAVYYYGYLTFTTHNNNSYFVDLKKVIFESGNLFPKVELRDIYLMAINYCIGQSNKGETVFVKESFELYKMGLKESVFLENNAMSPFTFANICLNSLQLKEFDWAYSFIHKYESYLSKKQQENYVPYLLARYYYENKEYTKARRQLIQSDFSDILLNLNAKMLLLKMYFEEDEFDALDSLLESIRTFLHRKKVMGYHRDNYKNVIRLSKKLLRINPLDKKEKVKLKGEIESTNPLMEKKWLLEQVDKL